MVRQAGFEPTTLWFVARYSIQLSYWRTNFAEGELYILESEKARVARKYSLIECRYTAANEAAAAEETKMPGQSPELPDNRSRTRVIKVKDRMFC